MAKWHADEVIEVLSCEIDRRPAGPGPQELAPFVKSASLGSGMLTLDLDEAGSDIASAFVAAEQVCCSSIGWELDRSAGLRLRISADAAQLKVLAGLVPDKVHIEQVQ